MTYKFLAADLAALEKRLAEYETYLREARAGIHESTSYNSETWHDNPSFDDQQQRAKMWETERSKLAAVRRDSELVEPSAPDGRVAIGSTVRVEYADGDTEDFVIGSYMVIGGPENRISYSTPIAQLLMGHKAGETVTGRIGGRTLTLKVCEVGVTSS